MGLPKLVGYVVGVLVDVVLQRRLDRLVPHQELQRGGLHPRRPAGAEGSPQVVGAGVLAHGLDFVCLTGGEAMCLECAGLAHLEYLPSGDTAVTRRATKYSALHVVVMKKSAARKRSERQGTLVEVEAVRRAEAASAADAEKRAGQQKKSAKRPEKEDQEYIASVYSGSR